MFDLLNASIYKVIDMSGKDELFPKRNNKKLRIHQQTNEKKAICMYVHMNINNNIDYFMMKWIFQFNINLMVIKNINTEKKHSIHETEKFLKI